MNLFESGAPKILFHYTNMEHLIQILATGHLKTKIYITGSHNLGTDEAKWKERREIATVRQSAVSSQDMSDVTTFAKGVRFIIQAHKLLDKQRGIKIKPIAEFPLNSIEDLKELIKDKFEKSKNDANKIVNRILKNAYSAIKIKKTNKRAWKSVIVFDDTKLVNLLRKEINVKDSIFNDLIKLYGYYGNYDRIKELLTSYYKWTSRREGEERIISNENIPLNPYYLKIELLPRVSLGKEPFTKPVAKYILLHKNLFVKNSSYKRIIKKAENSIKKIKNFTLPPKKS